MNSIRAIFLHLKLGNCMKGTKSSLHSLQSSSSSILGQDRTKSTSQFSAWNEDEYPLSQILKAPSMEVNEDTQYLQIITRLQRITIFLKHHETFISYLLDENWFISCFEDSLVHWKAWKAVIQNLILISQQHLGALGQITF